MGRASLNSKGGQPLREQRLLNGPRRLVALRLRVNDLHGDVTISTDGQKLWIETTR